MSWSNYWSHQDRKGLQAFFNISLYLFTDSTCSSAKTFLKKTETVQMAKVKKKKKIRIF